MTTISDVMEIFYTDHEVKLIFRLKEIWKAVRFKTCSQTKYMELLQMACLQGISFSCGGSILEPLRQRLGFKYLNILMEFMRQEDT